MASIQHEALQSARQRFDRATARFVGPGIESIRHTVRRVAVVASSSRGGSSMLAALLRRTPKLLHFRGEVNPFFVLAGLSWPFVQSDHLNQATGEQMAALDRRMSTDAGTASMDGTSLLRFPGEFACRLILQWPSVEFDAGYVEALARGVMREVSPLADLERFHVTLLARLHQVYPSVDPQYYDVSPTPFGARQNDGPPQDVVVEEPPFVLIEPWRHANERDLATRVLVIKTPSNVYRLDFLRSFFPNARFQVLHLVRNAASAINGLVDGWRYRGFFAHVLDRELDIAGYSDCFPNWGRRWWKFDLPPDWRAWVTRPLVDVCAFQWHAAHAATLDFLARNPEVETLRLPFEDLAGNADQRLKAVQRLARWLDIDPDPTLEAAARMGLPPVMATTPPRQRRWFERTTLLDPVLARPEIVDMMARLGYSTDRSRWT